VTEDILIVIEDHQIVSLSVPIAIRAMTVAEVHPAYIIPL